MYLIAQLWWYLLLAFLLGVILGYLLWRFCGRRAIEARYTSAAKSLGTSSASSMADAPGDGRLAVAEAELKKARTEVDDVRAQAARDLSALEARLAHEHEVALASAHATSQTNIQSLLADDARALSSEVAKARSQAEIAAHHAAEAQTKAHADEVTKLKAQLAALQTKAATEERPASTVVLGAMSAGAAPTDKSAPTFLSSPRNGIADDLKLIWGVGPKLEGVLHDLGVYHFDQIASWTPQQAAWVERKLSAYNVDMDRDKWRDQARKLATGWRPSNAAGDKPK